MSDPQFLASLGERIRELRMEKNMTQVALAGRCNFEKANLSRIEAGKTNISILTLRKISQELDIDITEFFQDT